MFAIVGLEYLRRKRATQRQEQQNKRDVEMGAVGMSFITLLTRHTLATMTCAIADAILALGDAVAVSRDNEESSAEKDSSESSDESSSTSSSTSHSGSSDSDTGKSFASCL